MKTKKLIGLIVALVAVLTILTACGDADGAKKAGTPETQNFMVKMNNDEREKTSDEKKDEKNMNDKTNDDPRFILSIKTEKTVFDKGESIPVLLEFENISEEDITIYSHFLIYPELPTASFMPCYEEPPLEERIIKSTEVITENDDLGGYFESGKHIIQFYAAFYLEKSDTEYYSVGVGDIIQIWSNAIEIEVR